ncbi:MAG: hypothetical protein PHI32_13940 [Dysgonamonadaceae bacterium]|nr:hypothetical protein [Dysgonamonadaceae bacterium]
MRLLKYIIKRLLIFIPQLIAVTIFTFLIVRLIPGSPAEVMAGGFATPEIVASIEEKMGLDQPLYVQYFTYMKNLL